MHGRKCLVLASLFLAGCSGNSLLSPDCHTCTTTEQAWEDFSWSDLSGSWKGSVETVSNDKKSVKKRKTDQKVAFRFLPAADFLKAKGVACESLPAQAVVMNGQLWEGKKAHQEYETFLPAEGDKVAYGRLSFEKMNGEEICQFRRLGRVMGVNRLALPAVSFSENSTVPGRALAAGSDESEFSLEFLRFIPAAKATAGRGPASLDKERPPLMIRISRTSSNTLGARGEWRGSEERLYRLWKTE